MTSVAGRFRAFREFLGMSMPELTRELGWKDFRIKNIEQKKSIDIKGSEALQIEEKFGISGWWLISGKGNMLGLRRYDALIDSSLKEDIRNRVEISDTSAHFSTYEIEDDLMSPAVEKGDVIYYCDGFVDRVGNGLYMIDVEGQIMCRRLQVFGSEIKILCDNKSYQNTRVDFNEDSLNKAKIKILGKVLKRLTCLN